jgi:hypothetical protein
MNYEFIVTLYQNIVTNKFWNRWLKDKKALQAELPVQLDLLLRFGKAMSDELLLVTDKDGARCQIIKGSIRINKIADTPSSALILAISDLQKEMYFDEKNKNC